MPARAAGRASRACCGTLPRPMPSPRRATAPTRSSPGAFRSPTNRKSSFASIAAATTIWTTLARLRRRDNSSARQRAGQCYGCRDPNFAGFGDICMSAHRPMPGLAWIFPALALALFAAFTVSGFAFAPSIGGWLFAGLLLVILFGTVFAAVHHAEMIAERIREPFGTLLLTVAVTIIQVALI